MKKNLVFLSLIIFLIVFALYALRTLGFGDYFRKSNEIVSLIEQKSEKEASYVQQTNNQEINVKELKNRIDQLEERVFQLESIEPLGKLNIEKVERIDLSELKSELIKRPIKMDSRVTDDDIEAIWKQVDKILEKLNEIIIKLSSGASN